MAHKSSDRFQINIRPETSDNGILARLNTLNIALGQHFAHLARPQGWRIGYLKIGEYYTIIGTRSENRQTILAIVAKNGFTVVPSVATGIGQARRHQCEQAVQLSGLPGQA